MQSARIKSNNSLAQNPVIPAKAGIQLIEYPRERGTLSRFGPLRGVHFLLDSGLMELLAIRLSWQTTPAKSLVIRRNDGRME
jgi:hypothetical protein